MGYALPLFFGFLSSLIGIAPPGLINMTVAKIGLKEGRVRALVFAGGASVVVIFQAYLALLFARFIAVHPEVVLLLREVGLVIFLALTVYFFVSAKKVKPKQHQVKLHSKRSRFFMGMLLSALNFFPIPFYVLIGLTLASYQLFRFDAPQLQLFTLGAGLGAYTAFWCYVAFFKKMEKRTKGIQDNMNYIIGSVTGLVSVFTLLNILQTYFG